MGHQATKIRTPAPGYHRLVLVANPQEHHGHYGNFDVIVKPDGTFLAAHMAPDECFEPELSKPEFDPHDDQPVDTARRMRATRYLDRLGGPYHSANVDALVRLVAYECGKTLERIIQKDNL